MAFDFDDDFDGDLGGDGLNDVDSDLNPDISPDVESDPLAEMDMPDTADISEPVINDVSDPMEDMRDYMYEHNYGREDYDTYSQDPEYQAINDRLLEQEGLDPVDYSAVSGAGSDVSEENAALSFMDEDVSHQYDIDNTETEGDFSESEETTDDTSADSGEIPVPEGTEETEETPLPGDLSAALGNDEFEDMVKLDAPDFYEDGSFYVQGINEYGYEGTCGPTSQANAVNCLLDTNELTENKVLNIAVENELCDTSCLDPAENGGTGVDEFMDLYDKVNESIGDKLDVECFDCENALSVDEMAEKLDEGSVLNIAVDSATLWDENNHIPGTLGEDVATDHWITVTGVDRNPDGSIAGFEIIDSGGGESYADAEKYERMCFGEPGRQMLDPTCIVVSKKPENNNKEIR